MSRSHNVPLRRIRDGIQTGVFALAALALVGCTGGPAAIGTTAQPPASSGRPAASNPFAASSQATAVAVSATPLSTAPGPVAVGGLVAQPLELTLADLQRYPSETQQVTFLAGGAPQQHSYTGTRLLNILNAAKPRFDAKRKNDKLRTVVLVTGSDGYQAAVAWGEIDPEFGNAPILLAWQQDGTPLGTQQGSRLTVPGDKFGDHYVSGIVRIDLEDA